MRYIPTTIQGDGGSAFMGDGGTACMGDGGTQVITSTDKVISSTESI